MRGNLDFLKADYLSASGLGKYMTDLEKRFECGRKDYRFGLAVLDGLGPHPEQKIRNDIMEIFRRAGKDV